MMVVVFRDVASYRAITLMIKAVSSSETSVSVYQTTQRNIPEGSRLNDRCHENLFFYKYH
jgi:hypothetical protein